MTVFTKNSEIFYFCILWAKNLTRYSQIVVL